MTPLSPKSKIGIKCAAFDRAGQHFVEVQTSKNLRNGANWCKPCRGYSVTKMKVGSSLFLSFDLDRNFERFVLSYITRISSIKNIVRKY